jgi:hypothetical protein
LEAPCDKVGHLCRHIVGCGVFPSPALNPNPPLFERHTAGTEARALIPSVADLPPKP